VTARDRLAGVLAPEVLEALEQLVDERVTERLAELHGSGDAPPWMTLDQAAERLGCTTDAVRMRVKRGRLDARRQGRRLYVSLASVDRLA
jgi:excisionase family DNA binding protein